LGGHRHLHRNCTGFEGIDKRTLYTVLSRPVRRWEFIAGKFWAFGNVMVNTFFMALECLGRCSMLLMRCTAPICECWWLYFHRAAVHNHYRTGAVLFLVLVPLLSQCSPFRFL
jgi:hypothetical protein